ncbi:MULTISPECIES: alpha/beta hydrolase [Microbacterium]|uniref:alpha/beta hydrolase n=1 Tax=Microbacterium TaxID=33882 RepID=UPI000697581E|nr:MULTISPECIES: alpha/beta hydrolase [unclassified Microbacterium]
MMRTSTVVLVHGAFLDASGWWPIVLRLLDGGHRVLVPPVIGRSFLGDCDYIRTFVERVDGEVLLVGHGYGAAVVTVAGEATNVTGLLFISGYALDQGESIAEMRDRFAPDEASGHLVPALFPGDAGARRTELTVAPDQFARLLAQGLPSDESGVLAVSQRPISASVFTERAPGAGWRAKPSWGVVATEDRLVSPQLQRFGYRRAGCRAVMELDAPHLVTQSHAAEIVQLIGGILEEIAAHG